MSLNAYQQAAARAEDPRETEYRLFGMIVCALMEVKGYDRSNLGALSSVIDWNKRVWGALAQDCADDRNGHGDALRAGIISLSMFVDRYSVQVIRDGADIEPLIDINRTVMQGLVPARSTANQSSSAVGLAAAR
ncbi:MAG: flagellar FlaF family protein [Robiginitomaculum sp.]|nr:MAG: flagellar FlaF family protein [Robiginitomaculum sp.]